MHVAHELDDLTGCLTRASFRRTLQEALDVAAPCCLLVLDLDYLKSINDHYGHLAGDAALRAVGAMMREHLRPGDAAGRYGGDEFTALIHGARREQGRAVAERILAAVVAHRFMPDSLSRPIRLSLSIGVAGAPDDGTGAETLFAAADARAYAAKAAGRNCVCDHTTAQTRPAPAVAPARLVGRQAEMERLRGALDSAQRGRGRFVTVEGEAGIGKTRLSEEVTALASLCGVQALRARCHEVEQTSPYHPFLDVLGPLVHAASPDALRIAAGATGGEIARLIPAVRDRLPEAAPLPPLPPEEDRQRLQQALCRFLVGLIGGPTVLVLDDLQWADEASVRVLNRLAWQLDDLPLLILGTVRAEQLPENPPIARALVDLERQGRCTRTVLQRLKAADAQALLRSASGLHELPAGLHTRLLDAAAGNPLFLLETLRLLLGESSSAPSPSLPIAPTVRAVIDARLARLDPGDREVLEAAAVLGRGFDLDLLARVPRSAGEPGAEARLWEACDRLERAQLLVTTAGDHYEFAHPLIREVAYAGSGTGRRRDLHRRAARACDALGASPAAAAEHHRLGGEPEQAFTCYCAALDEATAIHAVGPAVAAARNAIEVGNVLPAARRPAIDAQIAMLHERLGDLEEQAGDWVAALDAYQRAIRPALLPAIQARIRCKHANLLTRRGLHEEADAAYRLAAAAYGAESSPALEAAILLGRAGLEAARGDYTRAAELAHAARSHLSTLEPRDTELEADLIKLLGQVALSRGDFAEAQSWFNRGLAEATSPRWAAQFSRYLGTTARQRGDIETSRFHMESARAECERIGDQPLLATCLSELGALAAMRGRYDEARRWYEQALTLHRSMDHSHGISNCLRNLGNLAYVGGNPVQAGDYLTQSLAMEEARGDRINQCYSLISLGSVACDRGDFPAAAAYLRRAEPITAEVGEAVLRVHCLYWLAHVAIERGLSAEAAAWIEQSRRSLVRDDEEDAAYLELLTARLALVHGKPEEALRILEGLGPRIAALGIGLLLTSAAVVEAEALLRMSTPAAPEKHDRARTAAERTLTLAREHGESLKEAQALRLLALLTPAWTEAARLLSASRKSA